MSHISSKFRENSSLLTKKLICQIFIHKKLTKPIDFKATFSQKMLKMHALGEVLSAIALDLLIKKIYNRQYNLYSLNVTQSHIRPFRCHDNPMATHLLVTID